MQKGTLDKGHSQWSRDLGRGADMFGGLSMVGPEKAMAPHSSTLAWKIPWTEEPGRLQSMGLGRIRHN